MRGIDGMSGAQSIRRCAFQETLVKILVLLLATATFESRADFKRSVIEIDEILAISGLFACHWRLAHQT